TEMCALPVDRLLLELRRHEDQLRAWLDFSEANAVLFVQNPAAALRAANLGMSEETIAEFEEVLRALESKLGSADPIAHDISRTA
ncbi:MAG: hypothetical protein ACM3SW_14235, partial [Actinomycetota bacterium]